MDGQTFGEKFDWPTLATHAGDVGRFIWYLSSSTAEIDETLQRMTRFKTHNAKFPAAEFIEQIHSEDQPLVWLAVNEALATGGGYNVEFRFVRQNGSIIWLAGQGRLTDLPDGGQAILGVNYDITEQRTLQERYELVAGEMEHRVKNLLTMVGSIYRSTARSATSVDDLSDAFMPRLQSLASLNGLAARSGHSEVELDALVEAALQPVVGRGVIRHVDPYYVNGTMAQTLSLVLNELLTNAIKYGGLANDAGNVSVEIKTDADLLTLIWTEDVDYDVVAPVNPTGFGMQVLTNMTAATFQGRPQFTWRKKGLTFQCDWPLDKVQPHPRHR